jgi:hypothetical protein
MLCSVFSYWKVTADVGQITDRSSPPNSRAAARILREVGLTAAAVLVETRGVAAALDTVENLKPA